MAVAVGVAVALALVVAVTWVVAVAGGFIGFGKWKNVV